MEVRSMRVAWKPCIAEMIGAFALCFIGAGAICANALPGVQSGLLGVAIAHGLVLSIMVSATGTSPAATSTRPSPPPSGPPRG